MDGGQVAQRPPLGDVDRQVAGVDAGSDVDLLVDLPPGMGLIGLGRVRADLEAIVGAKVDLVRASDLKPAVRERAERDLVAL